jgi:exopolyphosphatase/guanosine-5'-triphosphate,3'-diphosphate pyrophosphatase
MRIAAIDIGTNSVHMIVADVRPDGSFSIADREKEMIRLGAGGMNGRALTEGSVRAALEALGRFARIAASRRVDTTIATATSAVRESSNGGEFLRLVRAQTGIDAAVISGPEEARLIHAAAVYGVDVGRASAVVVDIGGGSTEITLGTSAGPRLVRSFKLGVLRLAEQFVHSDPLSKGDERRLTRHIVEQVGPTARQMAETGFDRVIGTSGTIRAIAEIAIGVDSGAGDEMHHRRMSAKQLRRVRKEITALEWQARLKLPNLDPRRADLLVPGAILLDTIVTRLGATEIVLSDYALREGLLLDYIRRHLRDIQRVERYLDVRRRSVVELAERCGYVQEHAEQVARLALSIFDATRPVHRLPDRARERLEWASLLHDIGLHISYTRHHKHSYYLIKNGGLRGFEPDEIEMIALTARYHRRATPRRAHVGFEGLSREQQREVRVLAAMLRLAEALDRSHAQLVDRLEFAGGEGALDLEIRGHGDLELEAWAAGRQVGPLERALGRKIVLKAKRGAGTAARKRSGSPVPGS